MEYVVLVLIVIVVGFQLVKAWRLRKPPPRLERQSATQSAVSPDAASEPPVAVSEPDEPVAAGEPGEPDELDAALATAVPEPPLPAARLHALESVLAAFGSSCAHPRELAQQADFQQAASLLEDADVDLDTVVRYALGGNWALACAALAALAKRDDGGYALDQVLAQFDKLAPWAMYFALAYFVAMVPRPPVGAPVVGAKDRWCDMPVLSQLFRDYFAQRAKLGDAAEFGGALYSQAASPTPIIKAFLESVHHPLATALVSRLDTIQKGNIDHAFLTSFGRFWADQKKPQSLVEPDSWNAPLATAQSTLLQAPVRSLLVSGEQLVGKTSFLQLLAHRLAVSNWSVFEAGGADLMAGQMWFGQLEGRVRQVVEEVTVKKKLIWYVPDLLQLARSGTHQGQSASILDQILPAVTAGRLAIWTEASPTGTARLLQMRPALRNILEVVRLEPQSVANICSARSSACCAWT